MRKQATVLAALAMLGWAQFLPAEEETGLNGDGFLTTWLLLAGDSREERDPQPREAILPSGSRNTGHLGKGQFRNQRPAAGWQPLSYLPSGGQVLSRPSCSIS
jgi:hypothetical protein